MLEERKISKNWDWIDNRWIMLKDGKTEEFKLALRMYSAVELTMLLSNSGFNTIEVYGDLAGAPYDHKAKRLVVVAHKAKAKV